MEKSADCHTAEELYEFLKTVPQGARKEMPIMVIYEEEQGESEVHVSAYDTYETEGCREIGLQIYTGISE